MNRFKFFIVLFAFGCSSAFGQSTAIQTFLEEHGEGKKFFVYQSVIRILNIDGNEDFNKLIKNVRRIVVHQPNVYSDSTGFNNEIMDNLMNELYEEEFEEFVQAKDTGGMRLLLLGRGEIDDIEFVLVMREVNRAFLAEIEGSLNMEYIGALANAKMSELTDYLK